MLYEIEKVKNYENEPKRRWFFDHEIDLTVWFDENDRIIGFQLCYDKLKNPHAMTWWEKSGYHHHEVDEGDKDGTPGIKGIPILLADGVFEKERVANLFYEKSRDLAPEIVKFVYDRLVKHSTSGGKI